MPQRLFAGWLTAQQQVSLGLYGSEFISDTAAHTPPTDHFYWAFIPKEATVFTTWTDALADSDGNAVTTPESHPSGIAIAGKISAITLESGAGWALLAPDKAP